MSLASNLTNYATIGQSTMAAPVAWDIARARTDPASPNRVRYRLSRPLADAGPFLAVDKTHVKKVATVARNGGTSDREFREALGWEHRGHAIQPNDASRSTGSAAGEIPDARTLFRAGGVEVLAVQVPALPNWKVPGTVARLIRSPADVFYYTGHGLSASGKLAIDTGTSPASCPTSGPFANWLGPTDLTSVWRSPMDLDVLVLAGCSVLKIDFSTSPPTGPGLAWAALLRGKGGPLEALLGYRGAAPCDTPNGNRIAKAMGARMAAGSSNFAHDWLTVNHDEHATNAAAIDDQGFWYIERGILSDDIKGPVKIP